MGLKDKHVLDEAEGKYLDNCSEFINMLNVTVMQHTRAYESSQQRMTCPDTLTPDTKGRRISSDAVTKPAPSVMVLTFSSACVLSERVTVNAKPLIAATSLNGLLMSLRSGRCQRVLRSSSRSPIFGGRRPRWGSQAPSDSSSRCSPRCLSSSPTPRRRCGY